MKRILKFCKVGLRETLNFGNWDLSIVYGNLLLEETDAIVNPANSKLLHGGGVAGAIVKVGGRIQQEMSNLWIAENGYLEPQSEDFNLSTAFTPGTEFLSCRYVIHTVGPNLSGHGDLDEEDMEIHDLHLKNSLTCGFQRAESLCCVSISVPSISAGIYGFPRERCANILINSSVEYMKENSDSTLELVRFVATDEEMYQYFEDAMKEFM